MKSNHSAFIQKIWQFHANNRRSFAWRDSITPYRIVISEIMLQQTQTSRVIEKFEQWMQRFPNFKTLAQSEQADVIAAWQGLGYNRRAKAAHEIAKYVTNKNNGMLPKNPEGLQKLPGIGVNTAGSICAFAFNIPTVFIETNIRTVFTVEFFHNQTNVSDKELLPLIQATVCQKNPREWYYALMDYGVHLKKLYPRINAASRQYTKQSKFEGSKRQVRGTIIKLLTQYKQLPEQDLLQVLEEALPKNDHNKSEVLHALLQEDLIKKTKDLIHL